MKKKFEQLSNKPSYMKHNGGLLFRSISKKKFEFKTKIKKTHLNKAGITHGGYICTIIDAVQELLVIKQVATNPV